MFHRVHLVCLLSVLAAALPAAQTFLWTMEAERADIVLPGTDDTPSYYPPMPSMRCSSQAFAGTGSLDLSGQAWRQATFDNPTDNHIWAAPQQGAIRLRWRYSGQLKTCILMQMTGKLKSSKTLDTDDGLSIRIRDDRELSFGYAWNNATEKTAVKLVRSEAFAPDRWYTVTARWNAASKPHLSLQLDDQPPVLGETPLGPTKCVAYHHLLWGNDTRTVIAGLWLDDVEVWDDPAMQPAR